MKKTIMIILFGLIFMACHKKSDENLQKRLNKAINNKMKNKFSGSTRVKLNDKILVNTFFGDNTTDGKSCFSKLDYSKDKIIKNQFCSHKILNRKINHKNIKIDFCSSYINTGKNSEVFTILSDLVIKEISVNDNYVNKNGHEIIRFGE